MLGKVRRALAGAGSRPAASSAITALRRGVQNPYGRWNYSAGSGERSLSPNDAAPRIFDGMADIKAAYHGPQLRPEDGVFAIGSCFAREIEHYLSRQGARVLSLTDEATLGPEFLDADGRIRTRYFHRFTPHAIAQDVARAFDALPGWDDDSSLLFRSGRAVYDFDLMWTPSADMSLSATLARRRVAAGRSKGLREAACVIITLGLIEAWRHRPTGFWCNQIHPQILKSSPADFEFHLTSYEETLLRLEEIHRLLAAHGRPDVQLVITVSPVPLQATFTDQDIVVANAESKALLRTAAAAFVRAHDNAHYFPSYEMVTFSHPKHAWRPDRLHVKAQMVSEVVSRFMALYYSAPDDPGPGP